MSVHTYRKKPVEIQAIQWAGDINEVRNFLRSDFDGLRGITSIAIKTLEGITVASLDDFIIRGVKGEHYACKPDIFHITYEEVI